MKNVEIEKTNTTPYVLFKYNSGELKIEGRSIPEDPGDFYDPLFGWVLKYYEMPQKITRLDLQLEYINSGSSKYILGLLRIMKENYEKGNECIINWYYEEDDESVLELGEHYKNILKIPFNLVEIY